MRRVIAGESIEITQRGRRVAMIVPIPQKDDAVDRLVAQGLATPAKGDLLELPPPIRLPPGSKLPSEILEELRSDER